MIFNLFRNSFQRTQYLKEMNLLIDKAFERIRFERPEFQIYTISIWTDPNAGVSSINFDGKENSVLNVEKSNERSKKHYDQFLAEGDLQQAELFRPISGTRLCNPADFELSDFEVIKHKSFSENWEDRSQGRCWNLLKPALIEVGNYAFQKSEVLNLEEGFELSINSDEDWYDQTWRK